MFCDDDRRYTLGFQVPNANRHCEAAFGFHEGTFLLDEIGYRRFSILYRFC